MRWSLLTFLPRGRASIEPIAADPVRRHLGVRAELMLAILPTAVVLLVFAAVEALTQNRLLFASLASSAFLIYLDPQHGTNQVRTLVMSQAMAALVGFGAYQMLGGGYPAGAIAMVLVIIAMITLDVMHPPAVATALSFAFRTGDESNVVLFALALALVAVLVTLQRLVLWGFVRLSGRIGATIRPHSPRR